MSDVRILKSKRCYIVKSSAYYVHVKTKKKTDFQICISAPLTGFSAEITDAKQIYKTRS